MGFLRFGFPALFEHTRNLSVFKSIAVDAAYIANPVLEGAKRGVTRKGLTGTGSASVQLPAFYNNVLDVKFQIVFGYPGWLKWIWPWSGAKARGGAPIPIPITCWGSLSGFLKSTSGP